MHFFRIFLKHTQSLGFILILHFCPAALMLSTNFVPDKTVVDYIQENGYVAERHETISDDGYISSLYRIPGKENEVENRGDKSGKRIALLLHGMPASAINWVVGGSKTIPFLLSNEGYDVWLWNCRGTISSRRHLNYTVADTEYWNFSFHEEALYDLSKTIDYILDTTGQKDVFLIGHSKGAVCAYILLSIKPEYNKKVRLLVSYAGSPYLKHAKSPRLQFLFRSFSPAFVDMLRTLLNINFFPGTDDLLHIENFMNKSSFKLTGLVESLFLKKGSNYDPKNMTFIREFPLHFPSSGSVKELIHFYQIAKSNRFEMFDFGLFNNVVYGRGRPPRYQVNEISTPTVFYYSDIDEIASKKGLQHLISEMKNVVGLFRVNSSRFNHGDFLWGEAADELVYYPTIQLMNKY